MRVPTRVAGVHRAGWCQDGGRRESLVTCVLTQRGKWDLPAARNATCVLFSEFCMSFAGQSYDQCCLGSYAAVVCRIIRPPRKRGGHVILDVCTGSCAGAAPSGLDSSSGDAQPHGAAIVRHVVARSDAQKWMGSAGYALAKSANWGDLWPSAYEGNEKQQAVNVAREQ